MAREGSIFRFADAGTLRIYTITDLKDEPVGDPELVYAMLAGLDGASTQDLVTPG